MCMKSVNITTIFSEDDLSKMGGLLQLGTLVNEVKTVKDFEDNDVIEKLTVVTAVNVLSNEEDPNLEKKYDLLWQLGTVGEDKKYDSKEVGEAFLDTQRNKTEKIHEVTCKSFTNQFFKFTLRNYKVSKKGTYYLKVYIRQQGDTGKWQIQSMNKLEVK